MKYCVIGGQYEVAYYGTKETLHAAKITATKNKEYWDNWKGWRTPSIWKEEDTHEIETDGMITYHAGQTIRVPNVGAVPYMVYRNDHWELFD